MGSAFFIMLLNFEFTLTIFDVDVMTSTLEIFLLKSTNVAQRMFPTSSGSSSFSYLGFNSVSKDFLKSLLFFLTPPPLAEMN